MKLMLERDSSSGNNRVGGREKQRQLGMGNRRIALKRNASVEIIEERMQRFRTSRMDTRLQTPVPRRKRVGGWEKNKDSFGQGNNIGREITEN